ncbi:MAG: PCMD domain-containing protein [Prevotella sp.]|nr:PCMD domain-containing protein [Bacteroides sp.]MCM1366721.1 PCMD domain-containing protein [Prevotella sp.]MCM1437265.1 PCMD domain-containing protein [Prevotella sp.]
MRFDKFIYISLFLVLALSACIKNDIPFPRIPQFITAFAVQDEISPASINDENYSVTVYLDEKTDIRNVKVTDFKYTEGAEVSTDLLDQNVNMTKPIVITLSKYQNYEWIISAVQNIERYFTVKGQIGQTELDAVGHRIIVTVPETADLSALTVTSIKLGPAEITTLDPDITEGSVIDLSKPLRINATCHGITDQWSVYAKKSQLLINTSEVTAWSQVIWAVASAQEDANNGFRYRKASDTEWITLPKEQITFSGGTFTGCIPHLTPLTQYVVQAYSDDNLGEEFTVTTQSTEILPNGSFDQWWLDGKVWCPWDENGERFWDTGNKGAATLGQSNVTPTDDTPDGTGKAAMLATKFVGIAGIGKLAAGSIYTGIFAGLDGTNGILNFGRPWTLRPTKLKGYMKFKSEPINYASTEWKHLIGRPDSCHIYIALADWTQPFEIRTNPKNRQLLDPNSPSIIAYGSLVRGDDTDGYIPFEIRLDYRSYSRVPSYMVITCAASKYGDYFTGGAGTILYVDQLSLSYDY